MRKTLLLLTAVVFLGISTSAMAAPRRDAGGDIVQRIAAALKRGVVRILDLGDLGWPKP